MSKSKYSPLPWRVDSKYGDMILSADHQVLAQFFHYRPNEDTPTLPGAANAAYVVQCVNEYEHLNNLLIERQAALDALLTQFGIGLDASREWQDDWALLINVLEGINATD